ncbi:hypothetical protein D1BOALGB6SA_5210 [Olavius sp. associated proteobacterium Delta 1]|nr:hypothetical protein D1BOALGB6SA_5210 [Olavius sp. associated proteobacterium Delta 1]
MADNGNNYWMDSDILPQPSPQDLRGRQSVRATFKLSARAIETMSIVSVHLGIKQKSLFDHLIEDAQSLSHIARELESEKFRTLSRIQKTFVISRRTLSCLDEISKQFQAPRDALVEYSIQRLLPVIAQERERHRRRKEILNDMNGHLADGLKILQKSKSLLGEDDPVFIRLASAIKSMVNAQSNVNAFVEKGEIIEGF